MIDEHEDGGKIFIISDDGKSGLLTIVTHEGALWFVTKWHPQSDGAFGWPSKLVRPPQNLVKPAPPGRSHRYILESATPKDVLSPDCPPGKLHGFEVRSLPPPSPKAMN